MAELARKTPATLQDFMDKAEEFINQEEAFKGDKESRDEQTKEPKGGRRDLRIREEGDEKSKEAKQVEKRKLLTEQEFNFTPLNTNIAEILLHIQDDPAIKWPQRMRAPVERRNMNKYCDFQQDHGHDTNNCVLLRLEIERHIKNRKLAKFAAEHRRQQGPPHALKHDDRPSEHSNRRHNYQRREDQRNDDHWANSDGQAERRNRNDRDHRGAVRIERS